MSSPAQILANQSNAQKSTGPVTAEGKARVSQNATKLGLFSITSFVRPEEQEIFENFTRDYLADLSPQTALEQTLAREIIHAAWRLRRCAEIESSAPEHADEQELDRIQASVDRARTTAQRTFHRALAELRRVQTERIYRTVALPGGFGLENLGQASCNQIDAAALIIKRIAADDAQAMSDLAALGQQIAAEIQHPAKQTQSQPWNNGPAAHGSGRKPGGTGFQPVRTERELSAAHPRFAQAFDPVRTASIPRSAPCPCGSREKYKRCCGKSAPPVLNRDAAPRHTPGSKHEAS